MGFMSFVEDLKLKFYAGTIVEKLLAINGIAFASFFLFKTVAFLFQWQEDLLFEWLVFPKDAEEFLYKPWTIITYAFLHAGVLHLLFNMILLYFSGHLFLTFFSQKRVLTVYLLGAIVGALVYMVSYNLFPAFSSIGNSVLLGASASVMAILVATATYSPNMVVRLVVLGNVKLLYIAAFFVLTDVVQIPMDNAGGHLSHLGGAFLGYLYASQLRKGNDIGQGFEKIMNWFSRLFGENKKASLKTVYKSETKSKPTKATAQQHSKSTRTSRNRTKSAHQQQIDAILDKISKSGYDSLTKQEKDFLFKVGKK